MQHKKKKKLFHSENTFVDFFEIICTGGGKDLQDENLY
jgi:hypothetical protein